MVELKEYVSLEDALLDLKKQVIDSLEFAEEYCPVFSLPEQLFYWLNDRYVYMNDPDDTELFMTMQTMMSGSRTGVRGGGDCDDATITSLACLITQGFTENRIVLAGREKDIPVHIYVQTFYNSEWYTFDLTQGEFNDERIYPYWQPLDFTINKNTNQWEDSN